MIRKKYCALKIGKIDKVIALEKHFKPIIECLKQIVENTANDESQPIKKEVNVIKDKNIKKWKLEDNEDNVHDDDNDGFWMDNSWLQLTSSKKQCIKESNVMSDSNYVSPEPRELSYERSHVTQSKTFMKRSMNRLKC